nr:protein kinase APK1B, chloroplastic-like isoform X3 [Ipomoea batatas]
MKQRGFVRCQVRRCGGGSDRARPPEMVFGCGYENPQPETGIPTGIQTQLPQIHLQQVARLSMTQHRNLVNLLGYCQEGGYQILGWEGIPQQRWNSSKGSPLLLGLLKVCAICMGSAPQLFIGTS